VIILFIILIPPICYIITNVFLKMLCGKASKIDNSYLFWKNTFSKINLNYWRDG